MDMIFRLRETLVTSSVVIALAGCEVGGLQAPVAKPEETAMGAETPMSVVTSVSSATIFPNTAFAPFESPTPRPATSTPEPTATKEVILLSPEIIGNIPKNEAEFKKKYYNRECFVLADPLTNPEKFEADSASYLKVVREINEKYDGGVVNSFKIGGIGFFNIEPETKIIGFAKVPGGIVLSFPTADKQALTVIIPDDREGFNGSDGTYRSIGEILELFSSSDFDPSKGEFYFNTVMMEEEGIPWETVWTRKYYEAMPITDVSLYLALRDRFMRNIPLSKADQNKMLVLVMWLIVK